MPVSSSQRAPAASGRPSSTTANDASMIAVALAAAALSVAGHVLGKAIRDALFLAAFPVTELPYFVLATGAVSLVAVGLYTRLNARFGPKVVVPLVGIVTALWLVPLWLGVRARIEVATICLYPWVTVTGTLLASGFWAVLAERFDPRRARRLFGWMGVATTVGGLAGGFGVHQALGYIKTEDLLLVLTGLNVLTSATIWQLGRARRTRNGEASPESRLADRPTEGGLGRGFRELAGSTYLRDIALLVTLGTIGGTIADYVLKDAASQALHGKRHLAEFFSLFHGTVGAVTLAVQLLVARPLLHRKGLAAALVALPLWLGGGAVAVAFFPVLYAAAALRGGENAVRNSFHRSAYELLFVPLGAATKRLVKPILDTLVERLADGLGAGAILLLVGVFHFSSSRLAVAVSALGMLSMWLVLRVRKGYVDTLSANLAARAVEIEAVANAADDDATARDAVRATMYDIRADELRQSLAATDLGKSLMKSLAFDPHLTAILSRARPGIPPATLLVQPKSHADEPENGAILEILRDLFDSDVAIARAALGRWDGIDRRVAPFAVKLLAHDELHKDATRALSRAGDRIAGTLADHLDDAAESLAVRRRLPRALAACSSPSAIDALGRALFDPRFDVRYHAGAALEVIRARTGKRPADQPIWAALRKEVETSRQMWEAQRLLDDPDSDDPLSGVVERRGAHSLRHVFRLLGLVLDARPLGLSYRAIMGRDAHLRGVGLEYLENVLPPDVKRALWPLIGDDAIPPPSMSRRSIGEVLKELAANRTTNS